MNLESFFNDMISWTTRNGLKLLLGLIVLSIGLKIAKNLLKAFNKLLDKKAVDKTLRSFLNPLMSILLKGIVFVFVLQFMGIELAAFSAVIASAGFAIGLALQGSLSNFSGGVILLAMRPFKVGDYIETSGLSGTVEKIEIFYTHLVTPDNKEIMIPNGTVANSSMINYTTKDTRRVDLTFSVGYECDILQVKGILTSIIEGNNRILQNPEAFVSIIEHGASSINFVVRAWTKTDDYWDVYFYLLEEAKLRFDEEEISIPYPQMDLHIKENK